MVNSQVWDVKFAAGGLEDLLEIIHFLLKNDGLEAARELSTLIQTDVKKRLSTLPYRGHPVPELEHIGQECREIHVKAYRIIYQPIEANHTVWILLIAHCRRSIQDMLRNRLLHYPANPYLISDGNF